MNLPVFVVPPLREWTPEAFAEWQASLNVVLRQIREALVELSARVG